jgi:hypothetical protein
LDTVIDDSAFRPGARYLKLLSAVFVLAALGLPDWRPPAPDVTVTQVDRNGKELSDSYPAICSAGISRGGLPVDFATGRCFVNGWVRFSDASHVPGEVLFSAALCTPSAALPSGVTGGVDGFWLDTHGAVTHVVEVNRDGGPLRNLLRRPDDMAFIRVDVVASTHAHR